MQATIVEDYKWMHIGHLKGLVLESDDGLRYPGLISIDLQASDADIDVELDRYFSSYATCVKNEDGTFATTLGPWAQIDREEARQAIADTLQVFDGM